MSKITRLIAIDWGSTNFRAYRLENGSETQIITHPIGVTQVEQPANFDHLLVNVLAPWRNWIAAHHVPVIMAGMIGSDRGWVDSGYQMLPQAPTAIKLGCIRVDSTLPTEVYLRPGLAVNHDDCVNVMRGEEVQLLGAMAQLSADCYVFPGTHAKWVTPQGGIIPRFNTVMTGELYHLLMQNSLLGQGVAKEIVPEAFAQGLQAGINAGSNIIAQLFFARSARILHRMPAEHVAGWLSGLLIGHEVATQSANLKPSSTVAIIAAPSLAALYRQAFRLLSINATILDPEEAIIHGFRSIYHELYS